MNALLSTAIRLRWRTPAGWLPLLALFAGCDLLGPAEPLPEVVRHEMLHALLDRGDHPPEYFVSRCGLTWESWDG